MIRLWISFACVVCIYIKMQPWFFGLSCIKMHHWWPKNQESYLLESPSMIGGIGHAYICSKSMPCIAGLLLLSNCPLQELSAGRQKIVPTGTIFVPINTICSRWTTQIADDHYPQPVGYFRPFGRYFSTLGIFGEAGQ